MLIRRVAGSMGAMPPGSSRQNAPASEPGTPSMSFGAAPQELTIPPAAMKRFRISIVLRRIVVISGSSTAL